MAEQWVINNDTSGQALVFEAFVSIEPKFTAKVTTEPLEQGSFAAYNKVISPAELRVTLAQGGLAEAQQDTLTTLTELSLSTDVCSIITPTQEFTPYNLESFNYKRDATNGSHLLVVDLKFVEIREVESGTATVATPAAPIKQSQSKSASDVSTADTGKTQAKEPRESVLSRSTRNTGLEVLDEYE